jgi:ubiquinone/menaquinone biosynthesis C-methylase UbiE
MDNLGTFINKKMKALASEELIIDVGGGKPFQKQMKQYKDLFEDKKYFSVDYEYHYRPTVVGDAHQLPIKSNSVKAVVCKAVLEHVPNPRRVVDELYRISRKGGKVLVYVPFLYPYHGDKYYKDYFRFSHDGLKELFKEWSRVELQPVRGYFETVTFLFPSPVKAFLIHASRIVDRLVKVTTYQVSGYYLYAEK